MYAGGHGYTMSATSQHCASKVGLQLAARSADLSGSCPVCRWTLRCPGSRSCAACRSLWRRMRTTASHHSPLNTPTVGRHSTGAAVKGRLGWGGVVSAMCGSGQPSKRSVLTEKFARHPCGFGAAGLKFLPHLEGLGIEVDVWKDSALQQMLEVHHTLPL